MYLYNWQSTIILCHEIHVECGLKNPLEISSTSFFWCQHSTVQCSQELGCHRTELSALNCQHRLWETKSPNKYNTDHWFTCDWKQLINSTTRKECSWCFQGRTIWGSTSFALLCFSIRLFPSWLPWGPSKLTKSCKNMRLIFSPGLIPKVDTWVLLMDKTQKIATATS